MHRTQISLKEDQYENLVQEANRLNISLSELIRRLADEYLQKQQPQKSAIDELAGIGSGTGEAIGRNHNRYLYSKKQ